MTAVINYNVAKSQDVNKPWWKPFPKKMKLGAAYNLFDGEELLEASILSIKQNVDYVCVVYQETSNFGIKCNESLLPCLFKLRNAGLIDELIPYIPKTFSLEEKKQLVSSRATGLDLGGATPETISDTFFNEMTKREMGRLACEKAACTHFMSMDTDEFYLTNELFNLKQLVQKRGYEGVLAKMRYFFKYPECELLPLDEENCVPVMYEIRKNLKFRLSVPYPFMIDPTRRLAECRLLYVCPRTDLVMYHYSFVRKSIESKVMNVSNRNNYNDVRQFLNKFKSWSPSKPLIHPHPYFKKLFQKTRIVKNFFNIECNSLESFGEYDIMI